MTYSSYKKSNIPWIGDIPEHWIKQRIKDCLTFKIGGTPATKNEEYFEGENIWVSIADINKTNGDYIYDSSIKINDDAVRNSNVKLIKKGSLLYSFKLSVGLTTFAGCNLYTNEAIASFEPNNKIDLNFLKYVFHAGFENNAAINIYGAKLFNSDLIKFAKFVMPKSIDEQQQIANYLDKKTAKIDTTIAKNEELIQLLEEKRVSLINQVVTKGLNPDVIMKDSGVKWIGEIPEHWDVAPLNRYVNVTKLAGFEFTEHIEYIPDGEIIALRALNIKNNKLNLNNIRRISKEVSNKLPRSKLFEGDLIFTYVGAKTGSVALIDKDNTYHLAPNIAKITNISKDKLDTQFLLYNIASHHEQEEIWFKIAKSGQEAISMEKIRTLTLLIPPIEEQMLIIDYLNEKISKIDEAVLKITDNIKLLEEYKTSLIHHVVTGKIDVRGEEI